MNAPASFWAASLAGQTFAVLRRSPPAVERLAEARLGQVLAEAGRAPFHRERLRELGLRGPARMPPAAAAAVLAALPPVAKSDLRAAGPSALRDGRLDGAWASSLSSGSTGEPFRVHYDARAWAVHKHLVKIRARVACGLRPGHRIAVVEAVREGGAERPPSLAERSGVLRRVSALDPPERTARVLSAFAPHALYGMPSALLEIARAAEGAGLRIPARMLFTTGELLDPSRRAALERAFPGRVLDVYGTSETKEIAWECPRGGRHVNRDVLLVEVLDPGGRPVAPGEEGEIVVTGLLNRAMPLLRYRTGDRGVRLESGCDCGLPLPLLGVVTGREVDYLELPGGVRLSPYACTCALERVPGLLRYQILQVERSQLVIRAHVAEDRRPHASEALRAALRDAGIGLEVTVELVERFDRERSGKFRVVRSTLTDGARAQAHRADSPSGGGRHPSVASMEDGNVRG